MTRLLRKSHLSPPSPKELTESACVNWAAVARREGVSRSALCLTLHGKRRSPRMRAIVAQALGVTPESIWPARTGNPGGR